ncbi:hypothetical protein NQZ68_021030 [Dissostichus eleginoides]|nr:hypothetical protein NQZ68_021030 [Dissostichus eleginoides]
MAGLNWTECAFHSLLPAPPGSLTRDESVLECQGVFTTTQKIHTTGKDLPHVHCKLFATEHCCPDLVCSALNDSYSGLVVEGWATATGSWTRESSLSPRVSGVKWSVAGVSGSQQPHWPRGQTLDLSCSRTLQREVKLSPPPLSPPLSPPLPLATQVSGGPVLAKGQRLL